MLPHVEEGCLGERGWQEVRKCRAPKYLLKAPSPLCLHVCLDHSDEGSAFPSYPMPTRQESRQLVGVTEADRDETWEDETIRSRTAWPSQALRNKGTQAFSEGCRGSWGWGQSPGARGWGRGFRAVGRALENLRLLSSPYI